MSSTASRPIPAKLYHQSLLLFLELLTLRLRPVNFMELDEPLGNYTYFFYFVIYLAIYTPLKKKSPLAIEIGAISGALPPLIGWVVAAGSTHNVWTYTFRHFICMATTALYGNRLESSKRLHQRWL